MSQKKVLFFAFFVISASGFAADHKDKSVDQEVVVNGAIEGLLKLENHFSYEIKSEENVILMVFLNAIS